jgi:hypothetical protein
VRHADRKNNHREREREKGIQEVLIVVPKFCDEVQPLELDDEILHFAEKDVS